MGLSRRVCLGVDGLMGVGGKGFYIVGLNCIFG